MIQEIGKILLLLIIPVLLIFKLKWDSILPMIIYFQFLLIWIQAEISIRQNALFSIQFEPLFEIIEKDSLTESVGRRNIFPKILIKNISRNPAYDVKAIRVLNKQYRPVPPSQWENKIQPNFINILAPSEEKMLCYLKNLNIKKELIENELLLEVSYFNQLGEWQGLTIKFLKDGR